MTQASQHAWYNGEITLREAGAPSVASITFHLGTGVFDGLMAYWNGDGYYLHRAEEHLVRFRLGAARMGLEFSWSVDELLQGIQTLLAAEPTHTQYVRPIAYRRSPELWVTGSLNRPVDVSIFTVRVDREIDKPLKCHISPIERISSRAIPGHTKVSGAYVNSFHARRTAEVAGFEDGIMLDREGRITEASAANLFVISDDRLITPPLNPDVFPGVTRKVVLEISESLGVEAREADLRMPDLERISGGFLCSTLMEIRALSQLDQRTLGTAEHPIYKAIINSFRDLTNQRKASAVQLSARLSDHGSHGLTQS
jgi:branched-chain amino acid aminotransferase